MCKKLRSLSRTCQLCPTFPRYRRVGSKVALFFWLAKTSKYKTNFKLSQLSKSLVACVRVCSDTFEKHQSSSVPIFQRNVGNFSTFQFWSLSISVAFLFSVCRQNYVLPLKLKKKRKNFPLSVFREVIHICLSFAFRCQIPSLLCVGTLASSLLFFQLQNVWLMSAVSFQRSYTP